MQTQGVSNTLAYIGEMWHLSLLEKQQTERLHY